MGDARELLEGSETRPSIGREEGFEKEESSEEEMSEQELESAIKRLKKQKAAGEDGIKNEAWIHAATSTRDRLRRILNKIWRGEG